MSRKISRRKFIPIAVGGAVVAVAAVEEWQYGLIRKTLQEINNPQVITPTITPELTPEVIFKYDMDVFDGHLNEVLPILKDMDEGVYEKLYTVFPTIEEMEKSLKGEGWFGATTEKLLSRTGYIKNTYNERQDNLDSILGRSVGFKQYQKSSLADFEAKKDSPNLGIELINKEGNDFSGIDSTLETAKQQLIDSIKRKDFERISKNFRYTIELEDMIDSTLYALKLKLVSDLVDSHLFENEYKGATDLGYANGYGSLIFDSLLFDKELYRQLQLAWGRYDLYVEESSYKSTMEALDSGTREEINRMIDASNSPYKHFSLRCQWYHTYTQDKLFANHMKEVYNVGIAKDLDTFIRTIQPKVALLHVPYRPNEGTSPYGITDKFAAIGIDSPKDYRPNNWKNLSDEELDSEILKIRPKIVLSKIPKNAPISLRHALKIDKWECIGQMYFFNALRSCCGRPPYSLSYNSKVAGHNEGLSERDNKYYVEGEKELENYAKTMTKTPGMPGNINSYKTLYTLGPGSLTFYIYDVNKKKTMNLPMPPELPTDGNLKDIQDIVQSLA